MLTWCFGLLSWVSMVRRHSSGLRNHKEIKGTKRIMECRYRRRIDSSTNCQNLPSLRPLWLIATLKKRRIFGSFSTISPAFRPISASDCRFTAFSHGRIPQGNGLVSFSSQFVRGKAFLCSASSPSCGGVTAECSRLNVQYSLHIEPSILNSLAGALCYHISTHMFVKSSADYSGTLRAPNRWPAE